jgi:hypothetical protein
VPLARQQEPLRGQGQEQLSREQRVLLRGRRELLQEQDLRLQREQELL